MKRGMNSGGGRFGLSDGGECPGRRARGFEGLLRKAGLPRLCQAKGSDAGGELWRGLREF